MKIAWILLLFPDVDSSSSQLLHEHTRCGLIEHRTMGVGLGLGPWTSFVQIGRWAMALRRGMYSLNATGLRGASGVVAFEVEFVVMLCFSSAVKRRCEIGLSDSVGACSSICLLHCLLQASSDTDRL
ncbi:hypothetical protein SDJN03_01356, partial [Cucurbita argyrosperma subsp. sororia]